MKTLVGYAEKSAPRPRSTRTEIKKRRVTRGGKGSDPGKLAWIRSQPCLLSERDVHWFGDIVEAHHHRVRGSRATDKRTVPLCAWHHRLGPCSLEALGREGFQRVWRVDLDAECEKYETGYYLAALDVRLWSGNDG